MSPETVPAAYATFHPDLVRLPAPGEKQARVVFRGAAKTTLTRALVLHAIRYRDTSAVLVVRATGIDCKADAAAFEALAPLAGMDVETKLADQMVFINGVPVWLKSPKGKVRGLNHTYSDGRVVRPDLVVLDDLEDEESARSQTQTDHLSDFLFKSVIPTAGQNIPARVLMLGTPISPTTLIARAMRQEGLFKDWTPPMVTPIVDSEGVPAWPDTWDPSLPDNVTDDAWATEYLLNPLPSGSLVFPPERTRWVTLDPGRFLVWVGVDPAGDGADATGIFGVALTPYGLYVVDAEAYTGHSENMPETVGMFVRSLQAKGWKVGGVNVEATGMSTYATPRIRAQVAPIAVVTEPPLLSKLERAMPLTLWHKKDQVAFAEHLRGTIADVECHTWTRKGATVTGHDDMPDAFTWAAGLATKGWSATHPPATWADYSAASN